MGMYRMPVSSPIRNSDERTINGTVNQSTSIRIDDSTIDVRRTWSSAKINAAKADSEKALIDEYVKAYGELYLGEFDPHHIRDWGDVIYDAYLATEDGKPFLIPWNQNMMAQVVTADPDKDQKIIVFYRGQTWAVTDEGIYPVDLYDGNSKIEIDTTEGWDEKSGYVPPRGNIIIYSDRRVIEGVPYPGIKIGDGNSALPHLPWFGADDVVDLAHRLDVHVADEDVHVTPEEKAFWNNKLNYDLSSEKLILTRN